MLSPSDTAIVFVLALLLFGPEQLPKLARQLGEAMRHIQSTTNTFMMEMERAADNSEPHLHAVPQANAPTSEPLHEQAEALSEHPDVENSPQNASESPGT
jgi:sec-independent protein translocase protein TatB